jgi:3-dehydroquinate dehydratase-2
MKIGVLNGPNLNLLGSREPGIYGTATLADLESRCRARASELGAEALCAQFNGEGQLIDQLHAWRGSLCGLVVNAGGYTHTSVALRDAVAAMDCRVVEVHLSNVHAREAFRHHSYLSAVAAGVICGLGPFGYVAALEFLVAAARSTTA